MGVRPTLCNKKVKTFMEVKDLCLFMEATMTVSLCKTRKCLADMDSLTGNLINNTAVHARMTLLSQVRCILHVRGLVSVVLLAIIGENK